MSATSLLDDATIDALIRGDEVHPRHHDLVTFVACVRASADRPPPSPSPALAKLMAAAPAARAQPAARRRRATAARAGDRGLAVKIGAGAAAAAAVLGAGAAGMLPAGADTVVRSAIEAITPVQFADEEREPDASPDEPAPAADVSGVRPGDEDHSADHRVGEGTGEPASDRHGDTREDDTVRRGGPRSRATTRPSGAGTRAFDRTGRHDDDQDDGDDQDDWIDWDGGVTGGERDHDEDPDDHRRDGSPTGDRGRSATAPGRRE